MGSCSSNSIRPLAWKLPDAAGEALKRRGEKKKKTKANNCEIQNTRVEKNPKIFHREKIKQTSTIKQVTYKGSEIHMASDLVTTEDARR